MRVVGVVVIDGNPLELGVQIPLHPAHDFADVAGHVGDVAAALRRHDQPEMMPVLRPLDGLLLGVHSLARGVIEHAMLAVGAGAFPSQVGDMPRQTAPCLARLVAADVRLDHHALAHSPTGSTARQVLSRAPFEAAQAPGELTIDAPLPRPSRAHSADLIGINTIRLPSESPRHTHLQDSFEPRKLRKTTHWKPTVINQA